MTFSELVLKWNNTWSYDYWWRKKYNVPFNSEAHRNMSQIDIKFEYVEFMMASKQAEKMQLEKDNKDEYLKTGSWIKERVSEKKEDDLFGKMDLSSF